MANGDPATTTHHAEFIPEIWLATALGQLKQHVGVLQTITNASDLGGGSFTVGDILHLPKRGALTASERSTEVADYTVQTPDADEVTLTLSKNPDVTFALSSKALSFQNQDTIAGYIQDAVIVLAEKVATHVVTALLDNTPSDNVVTSGGSLTEANVLSARKKLVDAKVPKTAPRYALTSTTQTNALLAIDRFTRYDSLGLAAGLVNAKIGGSPAALLDGGYGRMHGFDFMESQLIDVDGSPLTEPNFFYAKTGLMIAFRKQYLPTEENVTCSAMTDPDTGISMRLIKSWNAMKGCSQVTLDVLYGIAAMRATHLTLVKTAA
jgi:hypothetical protein